jgi:hypothetical protein
MEMLLMKMKLEYEANNENNIIRNIKKYFAA